MGKLLAVMGMFITLMMVIVSYMYTDGKIVHSKHA